MPTYKLTLGKLVQFLDNIRKPAFKRNLFIRIEKNLRRSLRQDIFTNNPSEVYEIWDASEMRRLIRTGGIPKYGSYNKDYLAWKQKRGLPPHVLTGTMRRSVEIDIMSDRVLFYIPSGALTMGAGMRSPYGNRPIESTTPTTRTRLGRGGSKVYYFNFGPIHEARKSILKAAMVFAWSDIISDIVKAYIKELTRV